MNLQAIIAAAATFVLIGNMATANEVQGKVTHVRDADTIEVRGVPIRFDGVDAPDQNQPGFTEGKEWMKRNYANRMVRCVLTGIPNGLSLPRGQAPRTAPKFRLSAKERSGRFRT